jgi:hypothetical protein
VSAGPPPSLGQERRPHTAWTRLWGPSCPHGSLSVEISGDAAISILCYPYGVEGAPGDGFIASE